MDANMIKTVCKSIGIGSLATLALGAQPAAAQASDPFLGQVMCAGFSFAPRGWAELNGQLLPISQNTALFSLLGTQYGGNGQTTFALPDMRGRALLHAGQGPGLTLRNQGESAGSEAQTLSFNQMPAHVHSATTTIKGSSTVATSAAPSANAWANTARNLSYASTAPDVNMGAVATTTIGTAGGGQPFSIMQPYLTVKCFISLVGVFPSQN